METLTNKPPRYEKDCQTEFLIEKPVVRLFMAAKAGEDQETQVWDNELFDFDYEVEPLLRVLCGKTLQAARAEVLQEQELRVMRDRQEALHRLSKEEQDSIRAMEDKELRIKEENVVLLLLRTRNWGSSARRRRSSATPTSAWWPAWLPSSSCAS